MSYVAPDDYADTFHNATAEQEREADARRRHTEGPWQVKDTYTTDGRVTIIANIDGEYETDSPSPRMTFDTIAVCEDEYGERLPNAASNARLIAAAPDLLEALKRALPRLAHVAACHSVRPTSEWAEHGSASFENCACEIAIVSAAIAKAEGRA